MSLRTPLSRVRGLGSARSGTHHWWMQRVTAIAMIPLSIWALLSAVALKGASYAAFTAWLGSPLTASLLLAFIGCGLYHLRLGLQVVIEDYVHDEGNKVACLLANTLVTGLLLIVSAMSVLKLFLGN